ncbi:GGDEF domain-containing protein [Desulforamulus hydrothermalis]|uniref:Diguanylate cyclase with GAF sensor n=1 Tax=Desulforamulus hydrothermalis Lam5 = DSM 18033 TaxID=1121428 RepID=K8DXX5_9FIRM|nr:sensor domain-containing diguanylate cyclase [Desulforamulus hydrothermalis]CCO07602.1 Diguanylate cyclase with GAF sensor [Desulforamulus hydrothermalis Lam5 = DSM 18033]SHH20123.1 diguanylate cyclase with GAF sensor [Desulforamulus hydrothermalis Lam5 = DSM 18033]
MARPGGFGLIYTWLVIGLGFGWLWLVFPGLNLDQGSTLALLLALGILAEWLAVPLARGYLSGSYIVVAACQLTCGGAATAWVTGLVALLGLGIANRGNPLRTILFNSAQHVLAAALADAAYRLATGQVLPVLIFTVVYFMVNHLLVYLYLLPGRRDHPDIFGWDALRWDAYTYLLTTPYGILMAALFDKAGTGWAALLFLPVPVAQVILRKYVHMELANRQLTALYQVARRLRQEVAPDDFFQVFLQECRRFLTFQGAVLYFRSPRRQLFLPCAAQGPWRAELGSSVVVPGEGLLGQALINRQPLVIEDVRKEVDQAAAGPCRHFRSVLAVPLLARGEASGLLVLGDTRPGLYEEKQGQIVSIMGSQVAMLLANEMLAEQLQQMAVVDPLTGLFNHRRFYRQAVNRLLGLAPGETAALLLAGVDELPLLNARYGHGAGDAVLQAAAGVLRDISRPDCLLGRYSGSRLAALVPGCDTAAALQLAERLRAAARDCRVAENSPQPLRLTLAVGVAVFPQDTNRPDRLFLAAEQALARAGELGRDRAIAYSQTVKLKANRDPTSAVT